MTQKIAFLFLKVLENNRCRKNRYRKKLSFANKGTWGYTIKTVK